MRDGIDEHLRKLTELSRIKKEYFEDIISGDIAEDGRTSRIILSLDEEFLECLDELKEEAEIESLAEIDVNTYPRAFDLKEMVEELLYLEGEVVRLRNGRRKIIVR